MRLGNQTVDSANTKAKFCRAHYIIPEYYTFINDEGNLEIWMYNRKPIKSGTF